MAERKKKWIAGATRHEGKLHAAAKKGGKIGKEARMAETLKGLNHKHA